MDAASPRPHREREAVKGIGGEVAMAPGNGIAELAERHARQRARLRHGGICAGPTHPMAIRVCRYATVARRARRSVHPTFEAAMAAPTGPDDPGTLPPPPAIVPPPGPGSILAVAAHPDDIESWCAGTLARAIDAGAAVRLLLVTSGDKGTSDPGANPAAVAARREREAGDAARRLGLAEVAFLRLPDGEVEDTPALRGELVAWIRRWRPGALFTHDPEHPIPPYLAHRDHRIVGRAALDAVYPFARDPLSFPGHAQIGLAPHAVREVWLFASAAATAYVDIAAGFERKIRARLAHESQTPDPAALRDGWRRRAAATGRPVGLPLAEAFTVLRLD